MKNEKTKYNSNKFICILIFIILLIIAVLYFYTTQKDNNNNNIIIPTNSILNENNELSQNTSTIEKLWDFEKKISIECPKGWSISLSDGEGLDELIPPDNTINNYVGIHLNSYEENNITSLYDYADRLAEGYDKYEEITIAGIDALFITTESHLQFGEAGIQVVLLDNGWLYQINYYSNNTDLYQKYYNTFKELLNTVELAK